MTFTYSSSYVHIAWEKILPNVEGYLLLKDVPSRPSGRVCDPALAEHLDILQSFVAEQEIGVTPVAYPSAYELAFQPDIRFLLEKPTSNELFENELHTLAKALKKFAAAWRARVDHELTDCLIFEEQLFFLNYAKSWYSNDSPFYFPHKLRTNVHSPNRLRININLQNSKDFREAFQCKVKGPICELW